MIMGNAVLMPWPISGAFDTNVTVPSGVIVRKAFGRKRPAAAASKSLRPNADQVPQAQGQDDQRPHDEASGIHITAQGLEDGVVHHAASGTERAGRSSTGAGGVSST